MPTKKMRAEGAAANFVEEFVTTGGPDRKNSLHPGLQGRLVGCILPDSVELHDFPVVGCMLFAEFLSCKKRSCKQISYNLYS